MEPIINSQMPEFKVQAFQNGRSVNIRKPQHWLQTGLTNRSGH